MSLFFFSQRKGIYNCIIIQLFRHYFLIQNQMTAQIDFAPSYLFSILHDEIVRKEVKFMQKSKKRA